MLVKMNHTIGPLLFVLALLSGCKPRLNQPKHVCDLPQDQRASLLAPLKKTPITVLIDERFTEAERTAILISTQEWNQSSQRVLYQTVFSVMDERPLSIQNPSIERFMNCKEHSAFSATQSVIPIIRLDNTDEWKSVDSGNEMQGMTIHCNRGNENQSRIVLLKPMDLMTNADTQETTEIVKNQFQSATTHELGHVLGLNHSCNEDGDSENYRSCAGIDYSHSYGQAVMYPWLFIPLKPNADNVTMNIFMPKLRPNANDELRLTCQYPH